MLAHAKHAGSPERHGGKVSITGLRGSGGLEQLSHVIISLERDQQSEDSKNLCQLRLLKDRDIGDTGVADVLRYYPDTGRLLATDEENPLANKKKGTKFKNLEGSGDGDFNNDF